MSIFTNLRPATIPPFLKGKDDLQIQREIVLQHIYNVIMVAGILAVVYWYWTAEVKPASTPLVMIGAVLLVTFLFTLFRQIPYRVRSGYLLTFIALVGVVDLVRNGLSGSGTLYLMAFGVSCAAFFGVRAGVIGVVSAVLSEAVVGYLMVSRTIPLPTFNIMVSSGEQAAWFYSLFATLVSGTCIAASIIQFSIGFSRSLGEQRKLARDLDLERQQLENRVNERTRELQRKSTQLDTARTVAEKITAQTDLDALLSTSVEVVKSMFGFYYVAVFIPDENKEYALLRAGSGDAGRQMLEKGHRLRIGQVGIVGYVMSRGEPRITGNVEEDPAHYRNPVLPETRSEMGLPMKIGDQVVGVLDVQSTIRNAFSPDDVDVLQTIANQLSSALEKAQLLKQYSNSLEEAREASRSATHQTWQQHLRRTRRHYAYRYRQMQVETIQPAEMDLQQVLWEKELTGSQNNSSISTIAVPIKLRDETLGFVNVQVSSTSVTNEMRSLIENAVNRMAFSLENVRLLEEIQIRAERERTVSEIATRVRSATDIESILRTTASELGKSLGVSEVTVSLKSDH